MADVMALRTTLPVMEDWLRAVKRHANANHEDRPNYYAANPQTLITSANPVQFCLGTGEQLLNGALSSCASANQELIIVTCFWAKSRSQEAVCSLLRQISVKALSLNRKIQVRLCFSSHSIMQKLLQTSSLDGKIYPPTSWVNLGLPSPSELQGLQMVVKSVFVRPFSVMHPKFIIIDRQRAFMPSCNVSWENWFEGCLEMRGEIVEKLLDFWMGFWSRGATSLPAYGNRDDRGQVSLPLATVTESSVISQTIFSPGPIPTVLLPSPHHINPRFRPFWFAAPPPPPTPLNLFLLHIFRSAKESIFIQSPNLTSQPVLSAMDDALQRGVDVHLVTSSRLMILEQLVTAGTITEFEIWKLRGKYRQLATKYQQMWSDADQESLVGSPGRLTTGYFRCKPGVTDREEPVKSHLKLVIVDGEIVVLGSGNMDRASWYTSQELGIAFFSSDMSREIRECVDNGLAQRVDYGMSAL